MTSDDVRTTDETTAVVVDQMMTSESVTLTLWADMLGDFVIASDKACNKIPGMPTRTDGEDMTKTHEQDLHHDQTFTMTKTLTH